MKKEPVMTPAEYQDALDLVWNALNNNYMSTEALRALPNFKRGVTEAETRQAWSAADSDSQSTVYREEVRALEEIWQTKEQIAERQEQFARLQKEIAALEAKLPQ